MYNETSGLVYTAVMTIRRLQFLIYPLLLIACSESSNYEERYNEDLWSMIKANNGLYVEFSELGGSEWTKVCFMGPYNPDPKETLGFKWDKPPMNDLSMLTSDGHNLIIFATDSKVTSSFIQDRGYGDFWNLSGECLSRPNAKVIKDTGPGGSFIAPKSQQ